jgi:hypothetical protein
MKMDKVVLIICTLLLSPLYADMIFPAAYSIIVNAIIFWPLTIAAVIVEIIVYKIIIKDSILKSTIIVVSANIITTVIGLFVLMQLPSGLSSDSNGFLVAGHYFNKISVLGFFAFLLLSIIIEGLFYSIIKRKILKPMLTSAIGNIASYSIIGIVILFMH